MMPFSIDSSRVSDLVAHNFVHFCNDLIRAEASRIALPQSSIDVTVGESVPDGGVDSRIREPEDPPASRGDWLPTRDSAWQYKSGRCPSANELAQGEFRKPEVERAMKRGEADCFLTAASIDPRKKAEIRQAIDDLYREHGQPPKGTVYSADDFLMRARVADYHPTTPFRTVSPGTWVNTSAAHWWR
jgi:hypothetical protein